MPSAAVPSSSHSPTRVLEKLEQLGHDDNRRLAQFGEGDRRGSPRPAYPAQRGTSPLRAATSPKPPASPPLLSRNELGFGAYDAVPWGMNVEGEEVVARHRIPLAAVHGSMPSPQNHSGKPGQQVYPGDDELFAPFVDDNRSAIPRPAHHLPQRIASPPRVPTLEVGHDAYEVPWDIDGEGDEAVPRRSGIASGAQGSTRSPHNYSGSQVQMPHHHDYNTTMSSKARGAQPPREEAAWAVIVVQLGLFGTWWAR